MSKDRNLDKLDSSVIAIPLLEEMKKSENKSHRLDVIIEINLIHPQKRIDTIRKAKQLIAEVQGKPIDPNEEPKKSQWEEYADHYLFEQLTPKQISDLAEKNDAERNKEENGNSGKSSNKDRATSRTSFSDTQTTHGTKRKCPIYKIWPDFPVDFLVNASAATVKADAAQISFAARGKRIVWAVIDSGVDGTHPHFEKHRNLDLPDPITHMDFSGTHPEPIKNYRKLKDIEGHGTHVAGIIAGQLSKKFVGMDRKALVRCLDSYGNPTEEHTDVTGIKGIAPECKIVSLRVSDNRGNIRTSRLIAALGFINKANGDGRIPRIHGVNISLGHGFDPEWFACGQSPLCIAVDRLIRSGTTVVVAAGNGGYGRVETLFKGEMNVGMSNTLRDPANSNLAITVGSTHRYMPHIYGVSYFSSKGPTGDGRLKPDLVAPGEKIVSCASSQKYNGSYRYVEQSGTSMAAPHVSGCIAAFLSIRSEFKNRPDRVKEIFLSTATDLGRERYFQGNGLVDLMRAIQSV